MYVLCHIYLCKYTAEEAVFYIQGKRKSHMPYTALSSIALGICGVWGGQIMIMTAMEFTGGVEVVFVPWITFVAASVSMLLCWLGLEMYARGRCQRYPFPPSFLSC